MKAIQIQDHGSVDVLEYRDVPLPALKKGQVLVKIKAASVNFSDTMLRSGNMPPNMMPKLPIILGVEGSGIIEDSNETFLQKGNKVAFLGLLGSSVYAEYVAIDADKLIVLNEDINLYEAAVIPVNYFTAYHMLKNVVNAEAGKIALIYAASGGVGTALIQIAKLLGLKVVALERREEKLAIALSQGADYAYNTSNKDWKKNLINDIGKDRINYVFNPVAGDSIVNDLDLLATLGHIVVFGLLGGLGNLNLLQEAVNNFHKAPTISFSEIYATYNNDYSVVKNALNQLYKWLNEGKIKPKYETMPLSHARKAHEKLENGQVQGKLLLTI
ncbi:quinone oxidoreductase family protein [Psychroserpens sp. S379A]|uniref:quinone oxidoreductase family protein n=1 Tax=Psychroserpens sp. S379A TaxID=3415137 RepID=UPI003C7BE3D7